jgi:serine/threonine protein kinase
LKDCNDSRELERILLHSIEYIAEIHNKNLFHGDIKPANIFYNKEYEYLSSDSGSLV